MKVEVGSEYVLKDVAKHNFTKMIYLKIDKFCNDTDLERGDYFLCSFSQDRNEWKPIIFPIPDTLILEDYIPLREDEDSFRISRVIE